MKNEHFVSGRLAGVPPKGSSCLSKYKRDKQRFGQRRIRNVKAFNLILSGCVTHIQSHIKTKHNCRKALGQGDCSDYILIHPGNLQVINQRFTLHRTGSGSFFQAPWNCPHGLQTSRINRTEVLSIKIREDKNQVRKK